MLACPSIVMGKECVQHFLARNVFWNNLCVYLVFGGYLLLTCHGLYVYLEVVSRYIGHYLTISDHPEYNLFNIQLTAFFLPEWHPFSCDDGVGLSCVFC